MRQEKFTFASGNKAKLFALPMYCAGFLASKLIPRHTNRWVLGSGIGLGEGALEVARALKHDEPSARITWLASSDDELDSAADEGIPAVRKSSLRGLWETLRAGQVVITHGFGDVNRYGIFGAFTVQLWHGAPLKKLQLDSEITTDLSLPGPIQRILTRMYKTGYHQVSLYAAGSTTAAARLRTAFRVAPGKVKVLGDARLDGLVRADQHNPDHPTARAQVARHAVPPLPRHTPPPFTILYAPTWRDGKGDAAIPTAADGEALRHVLEEVNAHLVIRPHPLGVGEYRPIIGGRIHLLSSEEISDINPMLGAFDAVITDYSSLALDYSVLGRPIIWFAPDLADYDATRGLYEPLATTSEDHVLASWSEVSDYLRRLVTARATAQATSPASPASPASPEPTSPATPPARATPTNEYTANCARSQALGQRFVPHRDAASASRVIAEVRRIQDLAGTSAPVNAVFYESYYGHRIDCNPRAIDAEVAARGLPIARYWSVRSETQTVPAGAIPVLEGGPDWHAIRRRATLLIVNDWLRYRYRPRTHQTVLQTWHGTMLKRLALRRDDLTPRDRVAARLEGKRWDLLLSQNPHCTAELQASYAFSGEVLETGYPRDDVLVASVDASGNRISAAQTEARLRLGLNPDGLIAVYAPTWRAGAAGAPTLDVQALAAGLGTPWTIINRGHTRTLASADAVAGGTVVDGNAWDDINELLLAADVLITDYSSVMFDAAAARVPMLFYVPDLAEYQASQRGFTFDFTQAAPGPLLRSAEGVQVALDDFAAHGQAAGWMRDAAARYQVWCERFLPHDDGQAAARVVDELMARGLLPAAHETVDTEAAMGGAAVVSSAEAPAGAADAGSAPAGATDADPTPFTTVR